MGDKGYVKVWEEVKAWKGGNAKAWEKVKAWEGESEGN